MDAVIVKTNENKDAQLPKGSGITYVRVSRTRPIAGGARRGKPNVIVARSGRAVFNVEGTEEFSQLATSQGVDPEQCATDFGVNEEAGMVSVYILKANTPGTMPVRRSGSNCVIHLGGVFHDYPNMRVRGTRECAVTGDLDQDGVACLVIRLVAGVPKAKGSRKTKSTGGDTSPTRVEGSQQSQAGEQAQTQTPPRPQGSDAAATPKATGEFVI